jgi:O-acetyl-ADP-ribose deacetylase (regulator of RNase III)
MMDETVLAERSYPNGARIEIVRGDLTKENVDAIVNAANSQLSNGGGVAGAISIQGGAQIQIESNAWVRDHGPVSHGKPAYTSSGNLSCRYVIHAVGPVWGEGDEDNKLAGAIKGSLTLAEDLDLKSIALPAISTGIYGFPKERAARVILNEIDTYLAENPGSGLKLVRLTLFDVATTDAFLKVWRSGE